MCRQEDGGGGTVAAHQGDGTVIIGLRQAQPTVFPGDLHPETAELGEGIDRCGRNVAGAIHFVGVEVPGKAYFQLGNKLVTDAPVIGILDREWVDHIPVQPAAEQFRDETILLPFLLP